MLRIASWFPRRSGSEPSSDVRWRIATSASWSSARAGSWADVAGDDRLDLERLRELAEPGVPPHVSPLEGPLELDEEPLAAEGSR